jgi:4-amino-4-deoxy-L-arabinose transferase-like glycosyltransferase
MSIAASRRPVARLAVPRRLAVRRIPRAGLVCALVAFLNAACWSVITPPFQAPDEPSHFAYVQLLAEAGRLPTSSGFAFSQEEEAALTDLRQSEVRWHPEVKTISSPSELQRLRSDLASPLSRVGRGDAGAATGEPPAYYALETIPYYLGAGGTLLGQLELMRLVSALLGGLTALFCYLFVRESLPGAPWAWTVGGLAVALFPLFGFTSGAVTPDAMLFAVSAATFYCLARTFRRGLTRRRALAIGALTALGLLTKLNFVGLVPGVLLALAVLTYRGVRPRTGAPGPRRVLGSAALASAIALSPACLYALHNLSLHRPLFGRLSGAVHHSIAGQSLIGEASYVWQLYLPRLPGMARYFPGLFPTRELWFDRAVGLYGWLDTAFPPWVYDFALVAAGLIAALAVAASIENRHALCRRLPELLVYLVMTAGVLVLVGVSSQMAAAVEGTSFAQPRYLLPMLALFGATLAFAARGARRWGPTIGCLIVVLVLAHDVFSQLQVIARFYG